MSIGDPVGLCSAFEEGSWENLPEAAALCVVTVPGDRCSGSRDAKWVTLQEPAAAFPI